MPFFLCINSICEVGGIWVILFHPVKLVPFCQYISHVYYCRHIYGHLYHFWIQCLDLCINSICKIAVLFSEFIQSLGKWHACWWPWCTWLYNTRYSNLKLLVQPLRKWLWSLVSAQINEFILVDKYICSYLTVLNCGGYTLRAGYNFPNHNLHENKFGNNIVLLEGSSISSNLCRTLQEMLSNSMSLVKSWLEEGKNWMRECDRI